MAVVETAGDGRYGSWVTLRERTGAPNQPDNIALLAIEFVPNRRGYFSVSVGHGDPGWEQEVAVTHSPKCRANTVASVLLPVAIRTDGRIAVRASSHQRRNRNAVLAVSAEFVT